MDISNRRQNGNSIIKVDGYYNLSDMQNKSVTLETRQLIIYILAGSLEKTYQSSVPDKLQSVTHSGHKR